MNLTKMKNDGMEMIKGIALRVVHNYEEGFITEARYCWDQLKGAANMYVKIFGSDEYSGFRLAYITLTDACDYMGVNIKVLHDYVVAR